MFPASLSAFLSKSLLSALLFRSLFIAFFIVSLLTFTLYTFVSPSFSSLTVVFVPFATFILPLARFLITVFPDSSILFKLIFALFVILFVRFVISLLSAFLFNSPSTYVLSALPSNALLRVPPVTSPVFPASFFPSPNFVCHFDISMFPASLFAFLSKSLLSALLEI